MLSGKECPVVDPTPILVAPDLDVSLAAGIVDEPGVSIQPELLSRRGTDNSSEPAVKQLLSEIQRAMVTSSQSPRRRPFDDKLGILDTEYFRKEIKKILPTEWLEAALASVSELTQTVVDTLGADCTVGQALDMDLPTFAQRTGLDSAAATAARRMILGMTTRYSERKSSSE